MEGINKWDDENKIKSLLDNVSVSEIDAFISNPVYEALTETLNKRLELIRNELELGINSSGKELSISDYRERAGECSNIRYILRLLSMTREIKLEMKLKEEKQNEE